MVIQPINVVYCYAYECDTDQELRDELDKHISRIANVKTKNHHDVLLGKESEIGVRDNLNSAAIILLLESADFHSSANYGKLIDIAWKLYSEQKVYIVPVLLRPVDLQDESFSALPVLPRNNQPITIWRNKDEALLNVKAGVRNIVNVINENRKRELHLYNAEKHYKDEKYVEALNEYESARSLFPEDPLVNEVTVQKSKAEIWCKIATIHYKCKRWKAALEAYQYVVDYDHNDVEAYITMAKLYIQLSDLGQAIDICTEAIEANRNISKLYILKSTFLWQKSESEKNLEINNTERTNCSEKALETCDIGIANCSDKVAVLRRHKGTLLYYDKKYSKACEAYKAALSDDPDNTYLYSEYGDALFADKRFRDASIAYESAIEAHDRTNDINDLAYVEKLEQKRTNAYNELDRERRQTRALKSQSQPL